MNKKYIVTDNREIEKIINTGKKSVSANFIIYYISNEEATYNKYCVTVSRKIGKAHDRNKIKRRIKDILMKNKMDFQKKYVIIIRKETKSMSYSEIKEVLLKQIKEIN